MHERICDIADKYVDFYKGHKTHIDVTGKIFITIDNNYRDNPMHEDHLRELDAALDNLEKSINTAY